MTSTSIDTPATPGPDPTRAEKIDTALACILMMARLHGIAAEEAQLHHEFGHRAFETQTALLAAKHLGLSAKVVRQPAERLHRAPLPAIAIDRSGQHFIPGQVRRVQCRRAQAADPAARPAAERADAAGLSRGVVG